MTVESDAARPGAGSTGRCLCGAVRFRLERLARDVSVCHCGMCRRHAGGPVMAVHGAGAVEIEGADAVRWYRSSEWGERGFCTVCGATLFWRMVATGEIVVSWGALDDLTGTRIESHIFHDRKPEHYAFADDAPRYTEAQTLAMFAGGEGGGAAP